jgi:hypothetical protein
MAGSLHPRLSSVDLLRGLCELCVDVPGPLTMEREHRDVFESLFCERCALRGKLPGNEKRPPDREVERALGFSRSG